VAKLNPIDADKLGISNGDSIRIISKTGQIECHAKLWEGVRPGTVAKCYGQGHWAYGRVAAKEFGKVQLGVNNNVIIPADYDRLSGSTAFYGITRVKIVKV
jgi:anaerobic selenocysteine-containing dehydrogenase